MLTYEIIQEKYKSPKLKIYDKNKNLVDDLNIFELTPKLPILKYKYFELKIKDITPKQLKELINIIKYQYDEKININTITQYKRVKRNLDNLKRFYIHKLVLEELKNE